VAISAKIIEGLAKIQPLLIPVIAGPGAGAALSQVIPCPFAPGTVDMAAETGQWEAAQFAATVLCSLTITITDIHVLFLLSAEGFSSAPAGFTDDGMLVSGRSGGISGETVVVPGLSFQVFVQWSAAAGGETFTGLFWQQPKITATNQVLPDAN